MGKEDPDFEEEHGVIDFGHYVMLSMSVYAGVVILIIALASVLSLQLAGADRALGRLARHQRR